MAEYDEFPEYTPENYDLKIHTTTEVIKKLLLATAKSMERPALTGITLVTPGKSHLVATDGYIMSFESVKVDGEFNQPIILDGGFMKLVPDMAKGDITIQVGKKSCKIETENGILFGKLIDSLYPDIMQVVEKVNKEEYREYIEVDGSTLLPKYFIHLTTGALLDSKFNKFIELDIKYGSSDKPINVTAGKHSLVGGATKDKDFAISCDILKRLKMKRIRIYYSKLNSLNITVVEEIK